MSKVQLVVLVIFASLVSRAAEAEYSATTRAGANAAYTVETISENDYNADETGNVYKSYTEQNGGLVATYYRYGVNENKVYDEEISSQSESGRGNGETMEVAAGIALKNSSNSKAVSGTLYEDNRYNFTYTGDTADVNVLGGAVYNNGTILNDDSGTALEADFVGNTVTIEHSETEANLRVLGAALANQGEIGVIKGDFVQNYADPEGRHVWGGAIYNGLTGKIAGLDGDFIGNYAAGESSLGGVLFNVGEIGAISGDFVANYNDASLYAAGGAIHNNDSAIITEINGNFVANKADGIGQAFGGAVDNLVANIGNVTGDFNNNMAISDGVGNFYGAFGGAISNQQGHIGELQGNFYGNTAQAQGYAQGGAIYNVTGELDEKTSEAVTSGIDKIEGDFVANRAVSAQGDAAGGAIYNEDAAIGTVSGCFTNNRAEATTGKAAGGAIYNNGTIKDLAGSFEKNEAVTEGKYNAFGGAIYNEGGGDINIATADFKDNKTENLTGNAGGGAIFNFGTVTVKNSTFSGNTVAGTKAYGGAIFNEGTLNIVADGSDTTFTGNTANGVSNALYSYEGTVNMSAKNSSDIVFDDDIDGTAFDLTLSGDNDGDKGIEAFTETSEENSNAIMPADVSEIVFNSNVKGVYNLTLNSGSVMHLGKNATVQTGNYIADNATLWLDMAVDKDNESIQNGMITVDNDVKGNTNVIVNSENTDAYKNAQTPFLQALNDDLTTASDFSVSRVYGSPYLWKAVNNANNETEGSTWYLQLASEYAESEPEPAEPTDPVEPIDPTEPTDPTPTPSKPIYAPEVVAYTGLQTAAVEQSREISNSVARGLAYEKDPRCRAGVCRKEKFLPHKKAWIDASYASAEIDSPTDMDADVKGVTAGVDLYSDGRHRAGVFGAYRNGEYDLSGKGDYYSNIGSEIKTDSYLGGAYYKYNRNKWALLATLYAGKQDMDIKTDDRVAYASTDAMEYGASAELARKFAIAKYLNVEPSLGLRYAMVDIDDLTDNVGKNASFDTLQYAEAELGVKLEYLFCNSCCTNRLYVKPSILRTFSSGGKTKITGIENDLKTFENRTLGRIEAGGAFGLTTKLSAYTSAGYTFGDDYSAYDVNAGLNYAF